MVERSKRAEMQAKGLCVNLTFDKNMIIIYFDVSVIFALSI